MEQFGGRVSSRGMARVAVVSAATLAIVCAFSHRTLAASAGMAVSGTVRYYSNDAPVSDVVVQLQGIGQTNANTDTQGTYGFTDPGSGDWQVEPTKTGALNNAVSVLDATHVLQAVVGLRQFDAHQLLACDVTGDGTVSSLDATRILQFVNGLRDHFPVSDACGGSQWAFVPVPAGAPNQHILTPIMAPVCSPGAIAYDPLVTPVDAQDFLAVVFGDCTGNWQPATPTPDGSPPTSTVAPVSSDTPTPPATPTPTNTALPQPSSTRSASATASATVTLTATSTTAPSATLTRTQPPIATGTVTATPSRSSTATATATHTGTVTSTRTSAATATGTRTLTGTATATWTGTVTSTATMSPTRTLTPSVTVTRTATSTSTPTMTWTATVTRTGTRTATPTVTFTISPTPTVTCAHGLAWSASAPLLVSAQTGGNLWLAKTVPTSSGWGIFWLRQDPGASSIARLYYAHVDFAGQITAGPRAVVDIPKIDFRGHYYFVAWNQDHYGLTVASQATLYFYSVSIDGVASGKKTVGVPLFVSTVYDQESDGDLDPFPGGFLGVVEGACDGHSCSYAYKVDLDGDALASPINLVDFDYTHQFYPRVAFDGDGFAILSVKDIDITNGGVMTKYLKLAGGITSHAKVVPAKQYLWDEFPDVGWNGDHFAAVWTENSARSNTAPWQIHFATFRRTATTATLIADRVIDMVAQKTDQRWTTQVHAVGANWVAQYATRVADNSLLAVYELLGANAQTIAAIEPFALSADALGSSPHTAAGHVGELGIARGSNLSTGTEVSFQTLPPPACAP